MDKILNVLKILVLVLLGVLFTLSGLLHFAYTDAYVRIVPPVLPYQEIIVYISGAFEIVGGIGIFIKPVRHIAGRGLILLLIAVFPANIYMAMNNLPMGDVHFPSSILWFRLPMQLILIALVWWSTRDVKTGNGQLSASG